MERDLLSFVAAKSALLLERTGVVKPASVPSWFGDGGGVAFRSSVSCSPSLPFASVLLASSSSSAFGIWPVSEVASRCKGDFPKSDATSFAAFPPAWPLPANGDGLDAATAIFFNRRVATAAADAAFSLSFPFNVSACPSAGSPRPELSLNSLLVV